MLEFLIKAREIPVKSTYCSAMDIILGAVLLRKKPSIQVPVYSDFKLLYPARSTIDDNKQPV